MEKSLTIPAGVAIALGAAFFGTVTYIGAQVTDEIQNYEELLIARDDIRVTRFEYDRGLFSGQLHYDLNWKPLPDDDLYPFLAELEFLGPNISQEGINIAGTADLSHGPWVGGEQNFALARIDSQIEASQELRDSLPQYPGESPLFVLTSTLNFDGVLRTDIEGIEYQGKMVVEDQTADLSWEGIEGFVEINSTLSQFAADLRIGGLAASAEAGESFSAELRDLYLVADARADESLQWQALLDTGIQQLSLGSPEALITLSGFTFNSRITMPDVPGTTPIATLAAFELPAFNAVTMDIKMSQTGITTKSGSANGTAEHGAMQLSEPYFALELWEDDSTAWLGSSRGGFGQFLIDVPSEAKGSLSALDFSLATELDNALVNNLASFRVEGLSFEEETFGGLALETSLRDIDIDAYVAFSNMVRGLSDPSSPTPQQPDMAEMTRLIEKTLAGSPSLNLDRLALFLLSDEDLTASFKLAYDGPAQFDMNSPEALLGGIWLNAEVRASRDALEELTNRMTTDPAAAAEYRAQLTELYQSPFLSVSDEQVSLSLEVRDSEISLNGESLMELSGLLPMAGELAEGLLGQ